MNIAEASEVFRVKAEKFPEMVASVIQGSRTLISDYISDQLYSGKDGDEKDLKPDYLNDPYFAKWGRDRMRVAHGYMQWKMRISPPARSFIGLAPRRKGIPNLWINGYYHSRITTSGSDRGLTIGNTAEFASEIEAKYGRNIYKVSPSARKHFIANVLSLALARYWRKKDGLS